jgi:glycerol uptake facilitator protein
MGTPAPSLTAKCLAETLGTFILVFFGLGAVHAAVLTGAQSGLWQVAVVWGVAVMLGIYVVGGVSGAHINPAITISLATWGRFSWGQVGPYALAQTAGAFIAAAALFAGYHPFLEAHEKDRGVVRGEPGSEITAMCYGEYFPSPSLLTFPPQKPYSEVEVQHRRLRAQVSELAAFGAEVLGTLLLALVVFALTDERNAAAPLARLAPVFIGLTVAVLISVIAPLTQACFNPARDFGPRLFAYLDGWGPIAIPGPRGGFFTVYILAPTVGAVLGGGLYLGLLRPALPAPEPERSASV